MQLNKKKIFLLLLFILLFSGGIVGSYIYFSKNFAIRQLPAAVPESERQAEDFSSVRVYYPSEGRLVMEDRRIKRQSSIAAMAGGIVSEFLKGTANMGNMKKSNVPAGSKLLGIYPGSDG